LGINPADGALYIATHRGLWRAPEGLGQPQPVGDTRHDLMGFTVAGPDRFLASGHPGVPGDLPAQLGLQRSTNAGRSWQPVSLLGRADLHILRAAGQRVYGVDSGTGALLTSHDGGRSWDQRTPPAPMFDVAVAPGRSARLVAATEQGLFASADMGRTWRLLRDDTAGLLAWPAEESLYVVGADGAISRSSDGGRRFEGIGSVGAQPESFAAHGPRELYAADGGATWQSRTTP
jgi:photosystem II stability/assembly factor-like uncharacterized protein